MVKNRASSARFSWSALSLWVGLTVVGYLLNSNAHFPASFAVAPFNPQAITLDGAPLGFLFADGRVYSHNDLAKMVDNVGFNSIP